MRLRPTLMLAAVLATAACSPADDRSNAESTDEPATVTVHYYSANSSTWTDFGMSVLTLLFTPLMHEHGREFEGRLARSRELSSDGRTWTYHLRTDARWHDDVPVTAHDVKFTIELFQNPEIKNPLKSGTSGTIRWGTDHTGSRGWFPASISSSLPTPGSPWVSRGFSV